MTYKEFLKGHLNRMGIDLGKWDLETDEKTDPANERYELQYRNQYDGGFTLYAEIQCWPSEPSGYFLITCQINGD